MGRLGSAGKGALTGAGIGSFLPGIGTGIGAGIGALGGLIFGGGGDKKDDEDANPEDQYTSLLKQSAESNRRQGSELVDAGSASLRPALEYFKKLLSNNPAELMDATRGDRGRVIDQYDTARRSVANFGARGGGTTGALASSQFQQAESLADVTSDARSKAATGATAAGATAAGLGIQSQQLASQDLNSVINSVLVREGLNTQTRGQNMALAGDIGEVIGSLAGIWLGGDSDNGGGGPDIRVHDKI